MNATPVAAPVRGSVRRVRDGVRMPSPLVIAAGLIALQLGVRGWVAGSGYFYWDDLILVGRAGTYPLLSSDLLMYNHDGHFMPLAFAVAWVVTKVAPLVWAGPVVSMLVLQLAASVAVLRMLVVLDSPAAVGITNSSRGNLRRLRLAGRRIRWVILLPLVFYLFCPLTLPSFAWWTSALNALPLQIALAWVVGDAVLLVRTGRRRYAISGIAVLAVSLLFFEKSVVVPFVAFAVAALVCHIEGRDGVIRAVARRGAVLWAGSVAVLMCWLAVYLTIFDTSGVHSNPGGLRSLLHSATSLGIVPALLGGPWAWARWLPSTPWAVPPGWAVVMSWLVVGAAAVLTIRTRARVVPVWILVAAYVIAAQLPVALIRGGPNTAAELMQSLRYLADVAVVLTAAGALLLRSRRRASAPRLIPPHVRSMLGVEPRPSAARDDSGRSAARGDGGRSATRGDSGRSAAREDNGHEAARDDAGTRVLSGRTSSAVGGATPGMPRNRVPEEGGERSPRGAVVAVVLAALFVAGSLWSTASYARSWSISPTRTYLTNVTAALAADRTPLLDQEVPWGVLSPLAYPQNLGSRVLSSVAPDAFADSTPRLRMITDTGEVVPAQVWWNRGIRPGPEPGCGYRINGEAAVELPLDGPMLDNGWTAQLNYFADRDGRIVVGLEHGRAVAVPVRAGLHTAFVRVVGSGSVLRIASRTTGLDLCIGTGPVGVASYDR
ncbi:hypothetical protein [Nocardia mexicana]|uniref:Uncharacterized protein n=1 Tax=Nocardia mexicana TaxID=279262 RepID=A0A370GY78_9NOCA|nr:hypothetical protein [Nocardia mexicana]RDI48246.1 hypothetical protein DFR68_10875 [Nocardia mexicana]